MVLKMVGQRVVVPMAKKPSSQPIDRLAVLARTVETSGSRLWGSQMVPLIVMSRELD